MTLPTPLTTTFSLTDPGLSSSCFSNQYWGSSPYPVVLGPGTQCLPPGPAPTSWTLSTYYSPGIYCPSDYTIACSSVVEVGSVTETRATCCPRPVGALSFNSFICQTESAASVLATSPQFAQYGCTMLLGGQASIVPLTVTNTTGDVGISTFTVQPTQGPNAYSVQIRWQASDLASSTGLQTAGSTASNQATAASVSSLTAATSTAGAISKPSNTVTSDGGGLSTGAKAGIGGGIGGGVIAIAAVVALIFRRKRTRAQGQPQKAALIVEKDTDVDQNYHFVGDYKRVEPVTQQKRVQLGELEANTKRLAELQELPADGSR